MPVIKPMTNWAISCRPPIINWVAAYVEPETGETTIWAAEQWFVARVLYQTCHRAPISWMPPWIIAVSSCQTLDKGCDDPVPQFAKSLVMTGQSSCRFCRIDPVLDNLWHFVGQGRSKEGRNGLWALSIIWEYYLKFLESYLLAHPSWQNSWQRHLTAN